MSDPAPEADRPVIRTLLLLRHAQTEDAAPGGRDHQRRLTAYGERQARAVGDRLRAEGIGIDVVLCSSAVRTRQTCALLGLPDEVTVEVADAFYNAGADTLIEAVTALDGDVTTALIVGHAPGVPGVVYDLTDPATSDPVAARVVADRYPPATVTRLEFGGDWATADPVRLVGAWTAAPPSD